MTDKEQQFRAAVWMKLNAMDEKLDQLLAAKKRKPRKRVEYTVGFETLWDLYPKRSGGNPKRKAFAAFTARNPAHANNYTAMLRGTTAYAEFCKATHIEGTSYVMQAATFFGPDKRYLEDWGYDKAVTLPRKNDDLPGWAAEHGLRQPHPGEEYPAYRHALEGML